MNIQRADPAPAEARGTVAVVGAGMAGCLASIFLARSGYRVQVFESRSDLREGFVAGGKSINMTLSLRGLGVLEAAGVRDEVMPLGVEVRGRVVHQKGAARRFLPYGDRKDQVLYAVSRNDLNAKLLELADGYPNVEFRFDTAFTALDKSSGKLTLKPHHQDEAFEFQPDFVVGADGAFSSVRRSLRRGERVNYQREFLDWDYKEMTIPPKADGSYRMSPHALHVWPHGDCMMMALPNQDGSFNCICSMPAAGRPSFAYLRTEPRVRKFFLERFPDAVELAPNIIDDFVANAPSTFVTTRTYPWFYRDRVVLVGDAAHTVVPFYGQGMICAFEGCRSLAESLERQGDDREKAFQEYQEQRCCHAEILADLSIENFWELRDTIRNPRVIARRAGEALLHRVFPRRWTPIYTLIAHSSTPYAEALELYRRQQRIARRFGFDFFVAAGARWIRLRQRLKGEALPDAAESERGPRAQRRPARPGSSPVPQRSWNRGTES